MLAKRTKGELSFELLMTMGRAYSSLDLYEEAESTLTASLQLREEPTARTEAMAT